MRSRILVTIVAVCGVVVAVVIVLNLTRSRSSTHGRYDRGTVTADGGTYPYAVYVPSTVRARTPVPLIVVLHGCTMTDDQMGAVAGYDRLAEQHRFVVLYPDVDARDAQNGRCWQGIWNPGGEARDRGDARAIAAMTRAVMARRPVDPSRVYAIGISAGGFEASILGADYPDLYAAIGVHSGAAYMGCLSRSASPGQLARAARTAMGERARAVPVIVIHGDRDDRVPYGCGREAASQWLLTDGLVLHRSLPSRPTGLEQARVPGGRATTVAFYGDRAGCPIAELWTVHGMGHFWSGGSSDASVARFSDPRGPSAAAASWSFFSRWGRRDRCARAELEPPRGAAT